MLYCHQKYTWHNAIAGKISISSFGGKSKSDRVQETSSETAVANEDKLGMTWHGNGVPESGTVRMGKRKSE